MLHCSWDLVHDRCVFLIFNYFLSLYPTNIPKSRTFKKWKKCLEISSFYTCVPKIMITWCAVPEIWSTTDGWTDRQMEILINKGGCPPVVEMLSLSFARAYASIWRVVIIDYSFYFHLSSFTYKWGCKQVSWDTNSFLPTPHKPWEKKKCLSVTSSSY